MKKTYGNTDTGVPIKAPAGWKLLPEGEWVPPVHREATQDGHWCAPRCGHSTMTTFYARVAGWVRAVAVPDNYELVPAGATHVVRDSFQGDFDAWHQRVTYYREDTNPLALSRWDGRAWAAAKLHPREKLALLQS